MTDFTPLMIDEDNCASFLLKILAVTSYHVDFEVWEPQGWLEDGTPYEPKLYLNGTIKWDGCSHIYFGEKTETGHDGYLHLCGRHSWELHARLMQELFDVVGRMIENRDRDEWPEVEGK